MLFWRENPRRPVHVFLGGNCASDTYQITKLQIPLPESISKRIRSASE
jgi:hypothetical protein